jgi:hypothetical protein
VLVVVVVAGALVVCSVVVVVCAKANGAAITQANPIISFFMLFFRFILLYRFFDRPCAEIIQMRADE